MQDLARFLYYEYIVPRILHQILVDKQLPPFAYGQAFKSFPDYLRRCLFIGLSDGAKIDFFRRHNIDVSQEQVLPYYRTSADDYVKALQEEANDPAAEFWAVFLIDDFTGSGYTLLRSESDSETGEAVLSGSLQRVYKQHRSIIDKAKAVFVCEYVATSSSIERVRGMANSVPHYAGKLEVLCPLVLPPELGFTPLGIETDETKASVVGLCESYYDESFETHNTKKGNGIQFGYGSQGLPLILYSNTPNNSLFLLWFTSQAHAAPSFTALFPRIDRHKPL
jgi:hypothetical protein